MPLTLNSCLLFIFVLSSAGKLFPNMETKLISFELGYNEPGELCVRGLDIMKELINCKGFQVAPVELEAILLDHPVVSDAAVTGVEFEEKTTEYLVAYVTLQEDYKKTPQLASEI
ncbi:8964_t:CDS:2 [Diversispora eburnea]|uniref:8964_t:CDS:1 n=1 Tax=Diversispora eburnea TaxID=1213867 RepID=A0A9N9G9Z3_9GLOM|nr:8964_t:CDS:2 [Diversispora eburnea]